MVREIFLLAVCAQRAILIFLSSPPPPIIHTHVRVQPLTYGLGNVGGAGSARKALIRGLLYLVLRVQTLTHRMDPSV